MPRLRSFGDGCWILSASSSRGWQRRSVALNRKSEAEPNMTGSFRMARKVAVAVLGFSVLAFGVALIVLPGPAFLVIPLALSILATEFLWARKLLLPLHELLRRLKARAKRVLGKPPQPAGRKVQP